MLVSRRVPIIHLVIFVVLFHPGDPLTKLLKRESFLLRQKIGGAKVFLALKVSLKFGIVSEKLPKPKKERNFVFQPSL